MIGLFPTPHSELYDIDLSFCWRSKVFTGSTFAVFDFMYFVSQSVVQSLMFLPLSIGVIYIFLKLIITFFFL